MLKALFFIIIVASIALIAPFIMQGGSFEQILSSPSVLFKQSAVTDLTNSTEQQVSAPEEVQTFYKWQDAQGQWHYGDRKTANSQEIQVNLNTNVMAAEKIVQQEEVQEEDEKSDKPDVTDLATDALPDRIGNALEQVKGIKNISKEREAAINQAAGF